MKALVCEAFGPYRGHKVQEIAAPAMKPGHVRVRVKAAGVNFPDILIVEGKYQFKPPFPFIPGAEAAGVVTELGEGASGFALGDRVFFGSIHGCFAEEIVVPAASLFAIPEGMDFETAAAINLVYGTSWHALKDRAHVKPGDKVLVLGAAGGVGLAAVELAKAAGATVIAAAGSDEKLAVTRAHGADMTINYATEDLKEKVRELTGGGADIVYDPVGDKLAEPAFRSLAWEGRYLVVGFAGGEIPKLPLNLALLKSADLLGVFWGTWIRTYPEKHKANVAEFLDFWKEGKIRPRISAAWPLADFAKAYDDIAERRATGKVVLTMG